MRWRPQCGIRVTSLSGNELGDALIKATTDDLMREKAAKIGEKIRADKGVEKTIEWLYMHLERARASLSPFGSGIPAADSTLLTHSPRAFPQATATSRRTQTRRRVLSRTATHAASGAAPTRATPRRSARPARRQRPRACLPSRR
jgi:hypothetical protein